MFIVYGLLVLSVIVFIHESGHFIAAKCCGVEVEAFSIGMGPVLLHKKIAGTDWRISMLPFGGYCAMRGEKNDEVDYEDPKSFYGTHPLKRALIAFSGPFANFLFAFLAYTAINMIGYSYYTAGNKIQIVTEIEEYKDYHSAAFDAGIRTGDSIIAVNGNSTDDFAQLYEQIGKHPDEDLILTVQRDNEQLNFTVHTDMDKETGLGKIGVISDPDSVELKESPVYSFFPAAGHSFLKIIENIRLTFKGITLLFKGVDATKAVSGPARITTMLGNAVESGFSESFKTGLISILDLAAVINLSLFIMNLLPVPVLDGGLIFFAFIQAIFNVRISTKVQNRIQLIGIVIIVLLMIFAISGDIRYFLGK